MKLSILIPTIHSRKEKFEKLFNHVSKQLTPEVEILFEVDSKQISIGKKRQNLLSKACGEWSVFIDDDDWVPDNYVSSILSALTHNPDSVGFLIHCTGTPGRRASASNVWLDWGDNIGGFDYVRTPYQKTPIRTSICLQIGYRDVRYGEDYDFSKRLKTQSLIQSEKFIDSILYHYRFEYEDPKTKFNLL